MNFRGFPPGCGDSVADFWGWDTHGARLPYPDDVSGDMQEDEIPGGALSLILLTTQTMVTTGIFPCKKNSHGRTGNRTRDLMISSQRPWPLDYETVFNIRIWRCSLRFNFLLQQPLFISLGTIACQTMQLTSSVKC